MIASLLFMGGLRRSEVSALEWRDVSDARDGVLLNRADLENKSRGGRRRRASISKTARRNAIRTLRAADADAAPPQSTVPVLSTMRWMGPLDGMRRNATARD